METKDAYMTANQFADMIIAYVDKHTVEKVALALKVSKPTVKKWYDRKSSPHRFMYWGAKLALQAELGGIDV